MVTIIQKHKSNHFHGQVYLKKILVLEWSFPLTINVVFRHTEKGIGSWEVWVIF